MTEVIIFPDLFTVLPVWLQTRLTNRGTPAPVSYRIPNPRPTPLVRVSMIGGSRINIHQRQTRVLVEAWADTDPKAFRLAEICSAEIEAAARGQAPLAPGVWISADARDFSVPVGYEDPISGMPRYQFNCNLTLTGSAT